MAAKYYYVVESSKKNKKEHARLARSNTTDMRPCTPPLDRAPTPTSISSPPTPTYFPSSPSSLKSILKQSPRQVDFAYPLNSSTCRSPDYAEQSVMRAFSKHAIYCDSCTDAISSLGVKSGLCEEGLNLVTDLKRYFRITDGKAFSLIDEHEGRSRVCVEIPLAYSMTSNLVDAINRGFKPKSSPSQRPQVHQSSTQSAPRPIPTRHTTVDAYPARRQPIDEGAYEIRPSNSVSRRPRNSVYQANTGRFIETRTPYDDAEYAETRTRATPRTVTERTAPTKTVVEQNNFDVESKTSSDRSSKPRRRYTTKERSERKRDDSESRRASRLFGIDTETGSLKRSSYRPFSGIWN